MLAVTQSLGSLVVVGLVALSIGGCSVWQRGDIDPDFSNTEVHRGADVIAFSDDSRLMVSGGWDGRVAIWRPPAAAPEATWQAHRGAVVGVAFDGSKRIITVGADARLRVASLDAQELYVADTGSPVYSMARSGEVIATGHRDGTVKLWQLPWLRPVATHRPHGDRTYNKSLAGNAARGLFASSGGDGSVALLPADGGTPTSLEAPGATVGGLSFTTDGTRLHGGSLRSLHVWDVADIKHASYREVTTPHWGTIIATAWVPDDRYLATISKNNDSSVFLMAPGDLSPQVHLRRQPMCGTTIAASGNGRFLATAGEDGALRLWDLERGRFSREVPAATTQ